MNVAEINLKEQLLKLGFSYEKMLPRMYETDKSFVLMDGEDLMTEKSKPYQLIFTLIVIKPNQSSFCLVMLKANLKKVTEEGIADIAKREYWAHKEDLPSKYQIYKNLADSLKSNRIKKERKNR